MGKYDPLATFLRRKSQAEVSLTFRDIERMVGGILPKASQSLDWWLGEAGEAPQKQAWTGVKFTPEVDFKGETVRFRRNGEGEPKAAPHPDR